MEAVIEGLQTQTTSAANGVIWRQHQAPVTEYIFPEQVIGSPVPPANLETIPFLAQGVKSRQLQA
jgi:hypothetical protein